VNYGSSWLSTGAYVFKDWGLGAAALPPPSPPLPPSRGRGLGWGGIITPFPFSCSDLPPWPSLIPLLHCWSPLAKERATPVLKHGPRSVGCMQGEGANPLES
jgi:hypothetical protein